MTVTEFKNDAGETVIPHSDHGGQWATKSDRFAWSMQDATIPNGGYRLTHWVHDNDAPDGRRQVAETWHQADGELHRLDSHGPAVTVDTDNGGTAYEFWEHGKLRHRESKWRVETSYGWKVEHMSHADGNNRLIDVFHYNRHGARIGGAPVTSPEYAGQF